MTTALRIQGRQGRHLTLNAVYEQTQQMHNGRAVWVSQAEQPVYIYHTGKARWVVSKRVDDGSRCYMFVKDSGCANPGQCKTPVVCCDADGEWRADPNTSIAEMPGSNDRFAQLRASLDQELVQYGLNDDASLRQLWKRLDYNGNGIVSLAEIDKLVVEMVAGGTWPNWLNNKPALMRAYKKTTLKDGDGDDWVEKKEFHALLLNIFWFNKLWKVFDVIDGDDRRIDAREFVRGMSQLGLHLSEQDALEEFNKIDANHGGQVLFVEFCAYIRTRVHPDANPAFDADIVSGERCSHLVRRGHGTKATASHYISKKSLTRFNEAEAQMHAVIADHAKLNELWERIDYNGNSIVSLAEIDKLVVENYPLLNHKPALMRAYKAAIKGGDDDWVEKKEFKKLLGYLVYFNKLFWLFDNVDGDKDRRLTYQEFKQCLTLAGAKMTEQEMRSDFSRVDSNGGGWVLFDEFCAYFTQKSCPECLQNALQ